MTNIPQPDGTVLRHEEREYKLTELGEAVAAQLNNEAEASAATRGKVEQLSESTRIVIGDFDGEAERKNFEKFGTTAWLYERDYWKRRAEQAELSLRLLHSQRETLADGSKWLIDNFTELEAENAKLRAVANAARNYNDEISDEWWDRLQAALDALDSEVKK